MKSEQAQIMYVTQHPSVKSINDINLTMHTQFYIPKQTGDIFITGCIVCPNGDMIFVWTITVDSLSLMMTVP